MTPNYSPNSLPATPRPEAETVEQLRQKIINAKAQYAAAGNSMIHGGSFASDHMATIQHCIRQLKSEFIKAGGKEEDLP